MAGQSPFFFVYLFTFYSLNIVNISLCQSYALSMQTLTPHMQTAVAKANGKSKGTNTKKSSASKYSLGDQEQGNFSIELWKKAFRDACERLCPIRTEGHECGCLPLMARLVWFSLTVSCFEYIY